jgi:hypothetical protein
MPVVNINSGGYYTFALVKPGVYSIEAGAPGFDMISHKNLVLEIRQTIRQDFSLQVAGGKAQLTVLEDTPLLNTDSAELGKCHFATFHGGASGLSPEFFPVGFASPRDESGASWRHSHAGQLAGRLEILAVVLGALLGYRPNAQDFAFSSFSGQVNDAIGAAITNAEVKLVEQLSGVSFTARTFHRR